MGFSSLPDGKGFRCGGEASVNLEGVGAVRIGDLPPLDGLRGCEILEIEIGSVEVADSVRIAVGQDHPGGVGDDEVINARLLGCFDEQFLKLPGVPSQPGAGPRPRLKGANQGLPFFQEKARCFRLLPVEALHGHHGKKWNQQDRRSDDDPGRDKGPRPAWFHGLFHFHD